MMEISGKIVNRIQTLNMNLLRLPGNMEGGWTFYMF